MTMLALLTDPPMLADMIGGWEIVLILALILILIGARNLPKIRRGLGEGFSEFLRHSGFVVKELDQAAHDAGESLGGIYGKPAAEALAPDNQTTEFYDPAVLHKPDPTSHGKKRRWFQSWGRWWRRIWDFVSKLLNSKFSAT
jgi:Sec-independent protein translocase protein TatA